MTIVELAAENRRRYAAHYKEFHQIFGINLKSMFDWTTGFDVIKFDDEVIQSSNESMADVVQREFGDRAVEIVDALIS